MSLIEMLKIDHQLLGDLFKEIRAAGIRSEIGLSKLKESKILLLAHLEKEDTHLYPALKKMEEKRQVAKAFQDEMKEISAAALKFYQTYENSIAENASFSRDFGKFLGLLNNRIRKEEIVLYPSYEEHG